MSFLLIFGLSRGGSTHFQVNCTSCCISDFMTESTGTGRSRKRSLKATEADSTSTKEHRTAGSTFASATIGPTLISTVATNLTAQVGVDAKWNSSQREIFINCVLEQKQRGKGADSGFKKEEWIAITAAFFTETSV